MLINCGVTAIRYAESYPDQLAEDMLRESGVLYEVLPFTPRRGGPCVPPDAPNPPDGNRNDNGSSGGGCGGGCACGGT